MPQEAKRSPDDVVVKSISQRTLTLEDLLAAKEVFLAGSTTRVTGVVSLDDQLIAGGWAEGEGGAVCLALDGCSDIMCRR